MRTLVITYFYPPCTDGAATLTHNLFKYLPKNLYKVITASQDLGLHCWDGLGAYDKNFVFDSDVVHLPVKTTKNHDRILFFMMAVIHGLVISKKEKINSYLAVFPNELDLFATYLLHILTRKPYIVHMHDLYSEMRKKTRLYSVYKSLENRILSSAKVVLVTNEQFRAHYVKRGFKNLIVLHSCVDLQDYKPTVSRSFFAPEDQSFKIVFTGSIYPANEKALLCLSLAAKKVRNVRVYISTPKANSLFQKESIGFLPKRECRRLQQNADILFLPLSPNYLSTEEIQCAFPVKSLEYLAAGKPILAIVPKGCFMESFIKKHKAGIVVTELDEEKVIMAIQQLENRDIREKLGANSLAASLEYDAETQSKKLLKLLIALSSSDKTPLPEVG
jgi:glycosyltransferase involved in cell wall biosynthesis